MRKLFIFCSVLTFFLLYSCFNHDVKTRIEQVEADSIKNKEMIEILKKDIQDLRKLLLDTESRISALESNIERMKGNSGNSERLYSEISRLSKEIDNLQMRLKDIEDRRRVEEVVSAKKKFPVSETQAVSLISQARELLLKGEIDKAYEIMKDLAENGYSSYDMKFIMGEILFRKQDYRGSIREWLSIVQDEKNIKDKNKEILPRTYLRLSNAFLRVGDTKSSELMLLAIISKYPESPEAKTAKDLLSQIKEMKN